MPNDDPLILQADGTPIPEKARLVVLPASFWKWLLGTIFASLVCGGLADAGATIFANHHEREVVRTRNLEALVAEVQDNHSIAHTWMTIVSSEKVIGFTLPSGALPEGTNAAFRALSAADFRTTGDFQGFLGMADAVDTCNEIVRSMDPTTGPRRGQLAFLLATEASDFLYMSDRMLQRLRDEYGLNDGLFTGDAHGLRQMWVHYLRAPDGGVEEGVSEQISPARALPVFHGLDFGRPYGP